MARLRRNFFKGTITSALTNVATSMASAELANLPAIAAPDIMPIVLDPAAAAPEIVYITAHTAAATTATILRGQEGSTAIAHASGKSFHNGPTAYDFVPWWQRPAHPAHAADDAFETRAAGVPAGWTLWDPGTTLSGSTPLVNEFGLKLESANTGASTLAGIIRAVPGAPAGDNYTVFAHLQIGGESNVLKRAHLALLQDALANPTTSNVYVIGSTHNRDLSPSVRIDSSQWNDYQTFNATGQSTADVPTTHIFLKARRDNAANTITMGWSDDGVTWSRFKHWTGVTAIDSLGVILNRNATVFCDSVRVMENVGWSEPFPGQREAVI